MTTSDTQTPDAPRSPEFEARARALLARYAEDMPTSAQTEARARELLAPPGTAGAARTNWRPPRLGGPRGGWALGAISLGLVAALIIGFFGVTWLRSRGQIGDNGSNCSEMRITASDGSSSLSPVCPIEGVNVRITVVLSYVDPTRTALKVRIATPGAFISHGHPIVRSKPATLLIWSATLTDEQGHTYSMATGGLGENRFVYDAAGAVATGILVFDSLPQDELGSPQRLTLHITKMTLETSQTHFSEDVWAGPLNGSWATSFQVTPQAGRSIVFNVAPQTHHGVTVQPLRLDIGPDANVFDGYGGGERLLLRISGLPPAASAGQVAGFSTSVTLPDGGATTGSNASNLLLEGQEPAAVGGIVWDVNPPDGPVVGPTGTLVLNVVFVSPRLPILTGSQTLTIDEIITGSVAPAGAIKGPWTFQLELG